MPYDDGLAHRLRRTLGDRPGLSERRMFGGLSFLLWGNLACGVIDESMVARVGPDAYEDALAEPHARPFDFTGRPLRGLVYVDPPDLASDASLEAWVARSVAYASSLPRR